MAALRPMPSFAAPASPIPKAVVRSWSSGARRERLILGLFRRSGLQRRTTASVRSGFRGFAIAEPSNEQPASIVGQEGRDQ